VTPERNVTSLVPFFWGFIFWQQMGTCFYFWIRYKRYLIQIRQPRVSMPFRATREIYLLVLTRWNIFRSYTKLNKFSFYYMQINVLKRY
jgi:hypothetical protein